MKTRTLKPVVRSSNGHEAIKLWDRQTWQELLTLAGEGVCVAWKQAP